MNPGEITNICRFFRLRRERSPTIVLLLGVAVFQILSGLYDWFRLREKPVWLYWLMLGCVVFVLLNLFFEWDQTILRKYDTVLTVALVAFTVCGLFFFLMDAYQLHWTCRIGGAEYGIWQIKGETFLVSHGEHFLISELFGEGFPALIPCIVLLFLALESYGRRFRSSVQQKPR